MTEDLAAHTAALGDGNDLLYEQVALRISELVEHGTLRPGERVPSVRKYSEQQNVSIATVVQAYRLLEDRGILEARPQSGYYVKLRRWTPPPEPEKSKPAPRAVEVNVSNLVMEVIKASRNPAFLRFGASLPNPDLCPVLELNRMMASMARRAPLLAHGYDAPPGNRALRVQVARRSMEAGCTLAPDDITTTTGATEALNLALRAVANPGDVIAIESPTFFGILQIIESLGMRVCEIPTYPREGICLDELEERLDCCKVKSCLFTLNFSNPLGSCMPDENKARLVQMLSERKIPLIEDDLYGSLSFSAPRPKAAKAFDKDGWVLLCDSFTKTLSPGYRVGWIAAGRFQERVEFLKYVNTAATASLPQMAIAEFLQNGGYDHHLRKIRRVYACQMLQMSEAITRHFPPGTRITRPSGGMCLWIELPAGLDAFELYQKALAAKISIAPGPIFSAKQKYRNFIRIHFGNPWSEAIENGVRKLGQMLSTMAVRPASARSATQARPRPLPAQKPARDSNSEDQQAVRAGAI